jgi:hypothetical protein
MYIPTAKVRSVGEVHGIERAGLALALGVREGECRRAGPDAVKETILDVVQMKSVSMPSELFLDAGVDVDRIAGRAGSVNERRPWVEACGACPSSGVFEEAGTDMMGTSCKHSGLEMKPSGEAPAGRGERVRVSMSAGRGCTCEGSPDWWVVDR